VLEHVGEVLRDEKKQSLKNDFKALTAHIQKLNEAKAVVRAKIKAN